MVIVTIIDGGRLVLNGGGVGGRISTRLRRLFVYLFVYLAKGMDGVLVKMYLHFFFGSLSGGAYFCPSLPTYLTLPTYLPHGVKAFSTRKSFWSTVGGT